MPACVNACGSGVVHFRKASSFWNAESTATAPWPCALDYAYGRANACALARLIALRATPPRDASRCAMIGDRDPTP